MDVCKWGENTVPRRCQYKGNFLCLQFFCLPNGMVCYGIALSSSLELQLHFLPMVILPSTASVKCSFKIFFFGSAFAITEEGESELLALLINLHVNKMKPRKFLSACHMAVDACC